MTSVAVAARNTHTDADSSTTTLADTLRNRTAPLALMLGPALTVVGFSLHPKAAENDATFVANASRHPGQWAAAHLLIGIGLVMLVAGIGSILRVARGRGARFLAVGTGAAAIGAIGMAYDALGHGAVGYALAGRTDIPLQLSTHVQAAYEKLPFVAWTGAAAVFFPLGVILLGIGALRSRRVPTWAAILLLLGPVGIAIAGAGPLELLSAAPLVIGFASVALAVSRADV